MEELLPSYEAATSTDCWSIIFKYIQSDDLCNCTLVCRKWHNLFARRLWGSPASHFRIHDGSVYAALTRFIRALSWAPIPLRRMTHTLHLPPAHAEHYEGPHAEWLRDVLERLPDLQALIVADLSFFDHASLLTLRYPSAMYTSHPQTSLPLFKLRLLDASRCCNITANAIVEAVAHFPSLLYLDLSYCVAASERVALSCLSSLRHLRVLKLREVGLNDQGVKDLSSAVGCRARSLDVRSNQLTDASARHLLIGCFKGLRNAAPRDHQHPETFEGLEWDRPSKSEIGALKRDGGEQFEEGLRDLLSSDFIDHLLLEDAPEPGLTHLYISGSCLTVKGASALLSPGRLQVLDLGSVVKSAPPTQLSTPMSPGLARSESFDWDITTDVAMTSAMHSLSYLRIHHEVVTRDYTQQASEFEKVSPRGEGPTYTREITLPVSRRMQSPEHGRGVEQDSSIISPAGESEVRRRSYSGIRRQREAIVHLERTHSRRLTPGMLPTLRTLVLTGIPSFAATANIAQRLINFISLCAEHAYLAAQEAQVAYALPPGRSRHHAERDYAISLFALERIILEVSQQDKVSVEQSRSALLRSSTEDADSEAFWLAAESDFSFFRAEDDGSPEFGTPQRAPLGAQRSLAAEEKLRLSFNDEQSATPSYLGSDVKVDVVKMISDFRRARKLASDTAQSEGLSGESLTFVPGYWQGGIKVLREP